MKVTHWTHLRLQIAVAAATLFSLSAWQPPAQAQMDARFGGNTGQSNEDCAAAHGLGVGWVRITLDWSQVQPYSNVEPDYSLGNNDAYIACVIGHGIKVYATLAYAPSWAGGGSTHHDMPYLADWEEFVQDTLEHFDNLGYLDDITFGVWNEPDASGFFAGSVSDWIELFAAAADARDSVDTSARLAGPDVGNTNAWYETAVSGMKNSMRSQDVVTYHWYPGFSESFSEMIDYVRGVVDDSSIEIWLSEVGFNSCNDSSQAAVVADIASEFLNEFDGQFTTIFYYLVAVTSDCHSVFNGDGSTRASFYTLRGFMDLSETYAVSLQAYSGHYLVAESGGGNDVINADRTSIGPWETFELVDINGGSLENGDMVDIRINGYSIAAEADGDHRMGTYGGGEMLFWIYLVSGSSITNGSGVALRSVGYYTYVCAENGGGNGEPVVANRESVGAWETFTLIIH